MALLTSKLHYLLFAAIIYFGTACYALEVFVPGGGKTRCITRTFRPGAEIFSEFVPRSGGVPIRVTVWDWGRRVVGRIGKGSTKLHLRVPGIGMRRKNHVKKKNFKLKYKFCVRSRRPTFVAFKISASPLSSSDLRALQRSMRRLKATIAKMHAMEDHLDAITSSTVRVAFYTTFLSIIAIFVSMSSLLLVDESCWKVARSSWKRFSLPLFSATFN